MLENQFPKESYLVANPNDKIALIRLLTEKISNGKVKVTFDENSATGNVVFSRGIVTILAKNQARTRVS
ncbi:hypothetical protein EFL45_04360 [Weissella confusa]|uniref:hypothetical protein n=1 Tax=Weissella confusa TaxID=1583 RepID=UPI00223BECAB|nr:hypothetical protein [Weissella confusa]MCT0948673.1 hypothetical protein [Weissella confusa]